MNFNKARAGQMREQSEMQSCACDMLRAFAGPTAATEPTLLLAACRKVAWFKCRRQAHILRKQNDCHEMLSALQHQPQSFHGRGIQEGDRRCGQDDGLQWSTLLKQTMRIERRGSWQCTCHLASFASFASLGTALAAISISSNHSCMHYATAPIKAGLLPKLEAAGHSARLSLLSWHVLHTLNVRIEEWALWTK